MNCVKRSDGTLVTRAIVRTTPNVWTNQEIGHQKTFLCPKTRNWRKRRTLKLYYPLYIISCFLWKIPDKMGLRPTNQWSWQARHRSSEQWQWSCFPGWGDLHRWLHCPTSPQLSSVGLEITDNLLETETRGLIRILSTNEFSSLI